MKQKAIEFIFKRLSAKMSQLKGAGDYEIQELILEDMDVYLDALKDVIKEAILP